MQLSRYVKRNSSERCSLRGCDIDNRYECDMKIDQRNETIIMTPGKEASCSEVRCGKQLKSMIKLAYSGHAHWHTPPRVIVRRQEMMTLTPASSSPALLTVWKVCILLTRLQHDEAIYQSPPALMRLSHCHCPCLRRVSRSRWGGRWGRPRSCWPGSAGGGAGKRLCSLGYH